MRLCHLHLGSLALTGLIFAAGAGCVSSVRPVPGAAITAPPVAPQPAVAPPVALGAPPAPPAVAPPSTPAGPRLPWVNPARCLASCSFAPTHELVRLNRQGELDARGKFQLGAQTQAALLMLLQAARAAGHELRLESAYRSYQDQARVFADIKEPGRAARPGHSEHQLGTVADLRLPTSAAIDWLAAHAAGFGFALSYPPGKQKLTGYRPEPWHVRFVGRELAAELHDHQQILEEYFRAHPERGESGGCADCPLPASQAACGAATPQGSCAGSVLTWCYDGALATVDCATSQQVCGAVAGGAEYDCLPKPPPAVATAAPPAGVSVAACPATAPDPAATPQPRL